MVDLLVIITMLFWFAYIFDCKRAKKKRELEEEGRREEEKRRWELESGMEEKQRQRDLEEKYRQIERDYEIGNKIAAKRAAEPMIINLTIIEKDANGMEIGAPKPLSVKIALDNETASRLVSILRG